MLAIDPSYGSKGDFELADELGRISGVQIPKAIEEIRTASVVHQTECDVSKMEDTVKAFLNMK